MLKGPSLVFFIFQKLEKRIDMKYTNMVVYKMKYIGYLILSECR